MQRQNRREKQLFQRAVRYMKCNNRRRLFYLLGQVPQLLSQLDDEHTLLHLAAMRAHLAIVEGLLRQGADPDLVCQGNNTPLIHAAATNKLDLARMLLDYGADIEKSNDHFETPLGFACAYDAVEVVQLLCARGANVNGTEGGGHSYLFGVQCASGTNPKQAEIEQILLSYGARVIHETPKLSPDE